MTEEYNYNQIIRKDAKGCFVESLRDFFKVGKIHLAFASYDVGLPSGQRQTNNIHIFIGVDELQEICRKLYCGELQYMLKQKKQSGDYNKPLLEWLGGTSAAKLAQRGQSRKDGKSLSRTAKLLAGKKSDFLFIADSGPGEQNAQGLIVPRFGGRPENHVSVSMTWDSLSEVFLLTKEHYQAWLSAKYLMEMMLQQAELQQQNRAVSSNKPVAGCRQ